MAEQNNQTKQEQQQDIGQLLKVRREKLANLQEAGKDPFQITKYDVTHHSTEIREHYEELEGKTVRIAGRVMSKRIMGKASFCNIQDLPGNIQCYVARDSIGEEAYADFKKYDVGDIVGIEGEVFTTRTGEISVHAACVTLLAKSLQILPEKYHGLTNTDIRYRQRYDYESGGERHLYQAFQDHQGNPQFPGRQRLHGGGDPHAGAERGRRGGPAF